MKLIVSLTALFLSIVIHEVAHGYAAYRLGDPTARNANRLTLNPLAHIDPMGSIVLPILLVLMHSPVLIGWAKPVPFNPAYFRNVKKGIMLVGVAGPASNLVLALVAGLLFRILTPGGVLGLFLLHCCVINVILATFNLIPIPPLDGSRVVIGFLPDYLVPKYLRLERFGFLIIFGLLWLGALDYVIWPIADALLRFLL
ncbi:site-2 protease family protein [Thermodesulfobacteriota bacterium]